MRRRLAIPLAALVAAVAVVVATGLLSSSPAAGDSGRVVFGHSVKGRALIAVRSGPADANRVVLVTGLIHGDEKAGLSVVRRLRKEGVAPHGVALWTVLAVNPDGAAAGRRANAHGVDLNRNFSFRWSGTEPQGSGYYAGPRPFSEPESKALRDFILDIRPDISIHFHQPWGQVLAPCSGDDRLERLYSRVSGVPLKRCHGEGLPGTVSRFTEHRLKGATSFVVELPPGRPGADEVARNARAVLATARLAGSGAQRAEAASAARAQAAADRQAAYQRDLAALKPPIHDMLIPFPARRKREMAAYSKRHYGTYEWRLENPKLIIEHLSVTPNVSSVYNTFATDHPDGEFGQLPNTCAHYVIGASGAIFRLVPLTIRCRHVVGLNHVSVGIEHVGYSESDVLRRPKQLAASVRLTRWLRCRFEVPVKGVIGHAESLSSPYYKELDPRFRGQTHGDWRHPYMQRYRKMLAARGACPKR